MERLLEEASTIQRLLPWIESVQEIINYLRRIPLDKNHLRISLTMVHLLNERDAKNGGSFEQGIEDDAREIVSLLPDTPYKVIKDRLTILGSMPNRKEAVIRQLLHEKQLGELVSEIDVGNVNKRKSIESMDLGDQTNTNTNIKIKIRKVEDGSLEVVSSIKQGTVPVSPKVSVRPDILFARPSTEEITSSSDSDELPHSSTLLAEPRQGTNANKFISILNNIAEKKRDKQLPESTKPATVVNSTMDAAQSTVSRTEPKNFDLVAYVKEVTEVSEERIISVCKRAGISLERKPHVAVLNDLIDRIMSADVIELDNNESNEEMSSEEDDLQLCGSAQFNVDNPYKPTKYPIVRDARFQPTAAGATVKMAPRSAVFLNAAGPSAAGPSATATAPDKPVDLSSKEFSRKSFIMKPARLTVPTPSSSHPPPERTVTSNVPPELPPLPDSKSDVDVVVFDLGRPANSSHGQGNSNKDQDNARNPEVAVASTSRQPDFPPPEPTVEMESEEGRAEKKRKVIIDENLVLRLIEMFPQACPDYIRNVCQNKRWSDFDDVVTVILSTEDHPKRPQRPPSPPIEVDLEEQLETVKALLPDADPTYLRCQCEAIGNDTKRLNDFIFSARESKDYPTMKEYLRKQKLSAQSKQYTTEFNVENFVQLFPDPEKTFTDSKRTVNVDNYTRLYITNFFTNKYDRLPLKVIRGTLASHEYKIISSDTVMAENMKLHAMKTKRKRAPSFDVPQNIMILQELAYVAHKEDIMQFIVQKKAKQELDRRHAKENGLMKTCQCCFDDEVMPDGTFCCPKGCMFCRDCVQKSCEVAMGEGKTVYKCLSDCPEEFTLQTLQNVLPPKMFSKLAQKKTLAEVKAAGIEELETCPFCDFASIPNETDKIFRCLNADCMKESCRQCKEENHIPYKCDELEKDDEVKARVYLENKMSEALIRKCWKCGMSFFKEEGCNKMTCTCGAKMCYLCKKPVTDYSHFNGIGGDRFDLCPLYSDSNEVNKQNVIGAAEAAKAEIDPSKLKVDPTSNIQEHYKDRKRALPREAHLDMIRPGFHLPPIPPAGFHEAGREAPAPRPVPNVNQLRAALDIPNARAALDIPNAPVVARRRIELADIIRVADDIGMHAQRLALHQQQHRANNRYHAQQQRARQYMEEVARRRQQQQQRQQQHAAPPDRPRELRQMRNDGQ